MRTKISSFLFFTFACFATHAQVAINTTGAAPDNSAMLDITSSIKGLLTPRMTSVQRTAIASPATGLLVYDTDLSLFYYYNGASWTPLTPPTSAWSVNGNSGTVGGTNFIGTTDNQDFDIRTNNILHTRIRANGVIEVFNTGRSTYLGQNAGVNDDFTNNDNVAVGYFALFANTGGFQNTAVGVQALQNTTSAKNVAVGYQTMVSNTSGAWNTAIGTLALASNSTGFYNTAVGGQAMLYTTGERNVAVGWNSLVNNGAGSYNTAIGQETLNSNTTGIGNTALGYGANVLGGSLTNATAIGYSSAVSQSNSLVLGGTGSNAVSVGIGTTAPVSTLDVVGSVGMTVKNNQTAGTNNPDNTASIWIYTSGAGSITIPAASSCTNRCYVIVNKTGSTVNTSTYSDLTNTAQTTIATASSITIVSDGSNWLQIR